jgi:hypothetical protein
MRNLHRFVFALGCLTITILTLDIGAQTSSEAQIQPHTPLNTAPVISDFGDLIIGDLESLTATSTNIFVAPDLLNADVIVTDDSSDDDIIWSFTSDPPDIFINGVAPLSMSDDPTSPPTLSRLELNDLDPGEPSGPTDADPRTFTFRNVSLSPDNNTPSPGDPGCAAPAATVTLFASDGTTFGMRSIMVFTIRGTSDGFAPISDPDAFLFMADFTSSDESWIGGNALGFGGTVESDARGLCMTVPDIGENNVLWISPDAYTDLVDNAAYRIRSAVTTDQVMPDAIPLWFFIFDNGVLSGATGETYGSYAWVLDVDGGAQGIDRPQGRSTFDFWCTPNAVGTPQWQSGAFTPAADAFNDPRFRFQIIDANASILTDFDFGTICVENIQVSRIDRSLLLQTTLWNPPIDSSTHFIINDLMSPGTTASIDDGTHSANVALGTSGDVRVSLFANDPLGDGLPGSQFGPLELYPVMSMGDTLYRTRSLIRATAGETDPVDSIFLAMDSVNNELGTVSYTLSNLGLPQMSRAASPKLISATYEIYHFSHNATAAAIPNGDRLRGQLFVFNTTKLYGDGTGGDALAIDTLEIETITIAPIEPICPD